MFDWRLHKHFKTDDFWFNIFINFIFLLNAFEIFNSNFFVDILWYFRIFPLVERNVRIEACFHFFGNCFELIIV